MKKQRRDVNNGSGDRRNGGSGRTAAKSKASKRRAVGNGMSAAARHHAENGGIGINRAAAWLAAESGCQRRESGVQAC